MNLYISLKYSLAASVVSLILFAQNAHPSTINNQRADQVLCLAKNIYWEARNQSYFGQWAVGMVTMNRVKDARFPNTVCEVVYEGPHRKSWKDPSILIPLRDRCQFSWYCDGKPDKFPKHDEEAVMVAHEIADAVITGNYMDYTGGALFYHADYVLPAWAEMKEKTIEIDDHIFYKWN